MFDFIFENEKAATEEQWQEVKAKVQERIYNWRGEEYHDDAKEYRGEVILGNKIFSFSLDADFVGDEICLDLGGMDFGTTVTVKRVR